MEAWPGTPKRRAVTSAGLKRSTTSILRVKMLARGPGRKGFASVEYIVGQIGFVEKHGSGDAPLLPPGLTRRIDHRNLRSAFSEGVGDVPAAQPAPELDIGEQNVYGRLHPIEEGERFFTRGGLDDSATRLA